MGLFALAVMISRHNEGSSITTNVIVGYRVSANETEAKDLFFQYVKKAKPGFSIHEIACLEIPEGALRAGMMSQCGIDQKSPGKFNTV